MKWWRILGIVAVVLAMSGNLLGSEPEKRLQVRWSELKKLIGGKKVVLQLSDGARVEGRVHRVTEPSIVLWVKRSWDYPKGKSEIARQAVSRIEARDLNVNLAARRAKKAALTVGAAVGALVGSTGLFIIAGPDEGSGAPAIWGGVAIGSAVAVLMNLPRSRDVTLIEILPDSSGESEAKPRNKNQSSTPTASGEALALSLIEESSAERLRRQSRRAVMRQDLPLDLSSLPTHRRHTGIDSPPPLVATREGKENIKVHPVTGRPENATRGNSEGLFCGSA